MKQINVVFDDKDYDKILKEKKKTNLSWHDFILNLVALHKKENNGKRKK